MRYELGCCLKEKGENKAGIKPADQLYLHNNGRRLRLEFDCSQCRMRIYKA